MKVIFLAKSKEELKKQSTGEKCKSKWRPRPHYESRVTKIDDSTLKVEYQDTTCEYSTQHWLGIWSEIYEYMRTLLRTKDKYEDFEDAMHDWDKPYYFINGDKKERTDELISSLLRSNMCDERPRRNWIFAKLVEDPTEPENAIEPEKGIREAERQWHGNIFDRWKDDDYPDDTDWHSNIFGRWNDD